MKVLILTNSDVGLFKFRKELLEQLNSIKDSKMSVGWIPFMTITEW